MEESNEKNYFEWKGISYIKLDKKGNEVEILKSIDGRVQEGEIMAVVALTKQESSCLLQILGDRIRSDKKHKITGNINYHSSESTDNYSCCFVEKAEGLLESFTVRDNITYSIKLRGLDDDEEAVDISEALLVDFELKKDVTEGGGQAVKVGDTYRKRVKPLWRKGVSMLSKKKAALACQISSSENQKVWLIDGILDDEAMCDGDRFDLLECIARIAKKRKVCVVMSLSQFPSQYHKVFSEILVLNRAKSFYCGKYLDGSAFCLKQGIILDEHENPIEMMLNFLHVDSRSNQDKSDLEDIDKSRDSPKIMDESNVVMIPDSKVSLYRDSHMLCKNGHPRSFMTQFGILLGRNVSNYLQNGLFFWFRLAVFIIIALIISTLWIQIGNDQAAVDDRFTTLFFSISFLAFISLTSVTIASEEKRRFRIENRNGDCGIIPFFLANCISNLPFIFVLSTLFAAIFYPTVGLRPGAGPFFIYVSFLFLGLAVAESIMVFAVFAFNTILSAVIFISVLNGIFLIIQAYYIKGFLDPTWWVWLHLLDYIKYVYQGMLKNEFTDIVFSCNIIPVIETCFCVYPSSLQPIGICGFTGTDVLTAIQYNNIQLWLNALILIVMFLFYRIAFLFALKFKKQ